MHGGPISIIIISLFICINNVCLPMCAYMPAGMVVCRHASMFVSIPKYAIMIFV